MPIYKKSRLERRGDYLERLIDVKLSAELLELGFVELSPFLFQRVSDGTTESVFINIEPRWFSIDLCSIPKGLSEVVELYDRESEVDFALTGDLTLTPKGVYRRDQNLGYTYKTHKAPDRDKSIERARAAICEHVDDWFKKVRDLTEFVKFVSPEARMLYGRANELAGNYDIAIKYYTNELNILSSIIGDYRTLEQFALKNESWARQFIYVSIKLNHDNDNCAELKKLIGFQSTFNALRGTF